MKTFFILKRKVVFLQEEIWQIHYLYLTENTFIHAAVLLFNFLFDVFSDIIFSGQALSATYHRC